MPTWIVRALIVPLCYAVVSGASSLSMAAESSPSTTSKAARREAMRAIPFQKISPEYRSKVQHVLSDASLYRRLPTMTVDCHPPMFTHLVQNPDTLVQIWRQLGISNVELVKTGENTFRLADNVGTVGKLVIVEQKCEPQAQNRVVMYAEGQYDGKPFKKPVRAQCVMVLRSGSMKETNGRTYVAARFDTFVKIDRASLELFARALHPLVGKTADRNFADTMQFISSMSQAAELRPATIARLTNSLPHVSQERKNELVKIAYDCGEQPANEPSKTRLASKVD